MIGPVEYLGWYCLDCHEDASVMHDMDCHVVWIGEFFTHHQEMVAFVESNPTLSGYDLLDLLDEEGV